MTNDDYIWCPTCAGFGATHWVDDARGGHWVGCVQCSGLGVIPRSRLTPPTLDAEQQQALGDEENGAGEARR